MLDLFSCCFESRSLRKNPSSAPYRSAPRPNNTPPQLNKNNSNESLLDQFLSGNFLFPKQRSQTPTEQVTNPYHENIFRGETVRFSV